jgi:hypothetical protein
MKLLALFLTAFCVLGMAVQVRAADEQKQAETSKTVHRLFEEDQRDISRVNSQTAAQEYRARLRGRMAEIRTMIHAGELKTGDDFRDAAFIFQHGNTAEDCLFAHVLAMEAAIKGNDSAKWIEAATLDRYLQLIKQPQIFGTQYPLDKNLAHRLGGSPKTPFRTGRTLEPYNEKFLSDRLRFEFCVPTLAQQKRNVGMFNAGKRPRVTMRAPGCNP